MSTKMRVIIILLCVLIAAFVLLGCDDWDGADRSGFAATATASAYKAKVLAIADAEATRMVEELREVNDGENR